jgi:hypothetical protein
VLSEEEVVIERWKRSPVRNTKTPSDRRQSHAEHDRYGNPVSAIKASIARISGRLSRDWINWYPR